MKTIKEAKEFGIYGGGGDPWLTVDEDLTDDRGRPLIYISHGCTDLAGFDLEQAKLLIELLQEQIDKYELRADEEAEAIEKKGE